MELSTFLDTMVAPPIKISGPRLTENTPDPKSSKYPVGDLAEWTDIDDRIEELLQPHLSRKFSELKETAAVMSRAAARIPVGNENQVVQKSMFAYEQPAIEVLSSVFNIESVLTDHRSCCCIGDPDRVFIVVGQGVENNDSRFFVEYKAPWDLDVPDNLAEAFNEERSRKCEGPEEVRENNGLLGAVVQIHGYMSFNNLEFGALCTYEKLFLFQRHHRLGMRVSRAFHRSDKGLRGIIAALTYICHRVTQDRHSYTSSIDPALPLGTQILHFDPTLDFNGLFSDSSPRLWEDMELHFSKRLTKNVATIVKGEIRHESNTAYNKTVIFKIYDITVPENLEMARKEISAYKKLQNLQGTDIPLLYAAGEVWGMLKVLVLEDCGESAANATLPSNFCGEAERILKKIHQAGVLHGDVRLENIVLSGSGIRFIDLGLSHVVPEIIKAGMEELESLKALRKEMEPAYEESDEQDVGDEDGEKMEGSENREEEGTGKSEAIISENIRKRRKVKK
ncbi:hypothetical protein TWF281_005047 [Arthrobotrys megalospora]